MTEDYLEAVEIAMNEQTRDNVWWATLLVSRMFLRHGSARGIGVGPAAARVGFEESDALLYPLDGQPLPEAILARLTSGEIKSPAHFINTITRHVAYACLTHLRGFRRETDGLGRFVRRQGPGAPIPFIEVEKR